MKKSLKVLIASSAIMLGVSLLAGCEEKIPVSQIHEHTFSENWEASDSTHWHKATCEHTDVMSNVEDHKFGAWNTDKEPTQEAEGSKSRICTVCQYKQVAAIAKLDHTHVFAEAWSKDAEYHWHDATCHTDVRADVAKHTFGNWTVKVEPTETTKGLKERECSVCGYVEKAEVDQTLHVHTYASEWSTNETSHWKAATCEHADSFKDFGNHQFGEWVVDNESTETVAGSRHRICSVCEYREDEELPLAEHVHTWDSGWSYDGATHWHAATCNCEDANADNLRKDVQDHEWGAWGITQQPTETVPGIRVRDCQICHYRYTEEIPVLAHTHVYSSQWSKNATEHWHAATCGHNDSRADVADHTWGAWTTVSASTCTTQGTKRRTCSVCGYIENAPAELNNEAHKFATTWTYNESTHWHAATCGHAVKSGEAAHNFNRSYATWDVAKKCNTCGYIAEPAGKDTTRVIPNGYVTISTKTLTWFTFTLLSQSRIRIHVSGASANSVAARVYDSNYTMLGSNFTQNSTITSSKTVPAGQYFLLLDSCYSAFTQEENILIYNYTYVYEKEEIDTKDLTLDGVDYSFTMYEYEAQYGVDAANNYVTIENADGDEVSLFAHEGYSTPYESSRGSWQFRDSAGNNKNLYAPEFCYRSEQVQDSPYYFADGDEGSVTLKMTEDNWLTLLWKDPYWKRIHGFNELDANLSAWYAASYVSFTSSAYRKDPATSTYVANTSTWDWHGLFDMDFDEICDDMTYDSETEMYKLVKATGKYQSFKVTNTTEKSFSIFRGFKNATEYAAGNPSKGKYMASYTYIFDENGYRVNDYRSYNGVGNNTYGENNCAWFFNGTNDRAHRFEVKPGETYYFLDYDTPGYSYHATLSQSTYTISLNPNVEGEDPITYLDGSDFRGAKYQHQYSVYDVNNFFMENFEAPEGKTLAGWAGTPTGNVMFRGSPWTGFNHVLNVTNKTDGTLYAKWIDSANLIMTPYQCVRYDVLDGYSIKYMLNDIIDDDLVIKANDAVTYLYANGNEKEFMISEVGYGSSVASEISTAEAANHAGQNPFMIVKFPDVSGVHSNFIGMYQKQEFSLNVEDGDGGTVDLGLIDKGQTVTLPFYGDCNDLDSSFCTYEAAFGPDGAWPTSYFAYWEDDLGNQILDGGDYEPIKDTMLSPVYKDKAGSNVVALRYGISFETIDSTEYVKLTILDPNLTLNTSTSFKLLMSDGSMIDLGVTEFLTAAGVHLDSATTANGVILLKVFNMNTQHANIANCIQIIVA